MSHLLLGSSVSVLRHLHALLFGAPKPKPNAEQQASLALYSTEGRRVRAVPTRRPVNRKAS